MHRLISTADIAVAFIYTQATYAVDPNALESAYWRFEEGTANEIVPSGDNKVPDEINANHLMRWTPEPPDPPDDTAPMYTTDVPGAVVPRKNTSNTLAMQFSRHTGGGDDLFSSLKNINNPIIEHGFTLEASFKTTFVGGGADAFQGVVSKEGAVLSGLPRLALKIRGDDGLLHLEMFDGSGAHRNVYSGSPMVPDKWYHAAVVNTGTSVSLYLDSGDGLGYVLQGQDILQGGALFTDDANQSAWTVGRAQYYNNPADWFDGVIDEVRLTNVVLDPEDFLWAEAPTPGDFNDDSRVDEADLLIFEACFTGPQIPYDPENLASGCTLTPDSQGIIRADMDSDTDVDQLDFGLFQAQFGIVP